MAHSNSTIPANAVERDFAEFMLRGDDFFKIELLRQAKSWYSKALNLLPGNETAKHQLAECERLLAFEAKVIRILLVIGATAILSYFIVF
jgi:hypothetical protein